MANISNKVRLDPQSADFQIAADEAKATAHPHGVVYHGRMAFGAYFPTGRGPLAVYVQFSEDAGFAQCHCADARLSHVCRHMAAAYPHAVRRAGINRSLAEHQTANREGGRRR